jgi:hypothetical protein
LDQALLSRNDRFWFLSCDLFRGYGRAPLLVEFEYNTDHHRRQNHEQNNRRPIAMAMLARRRASRFLLITHFYFAAGGDGRLCPTVVVSGCAGVLDAVRSLNMPMDAITTMSATTAKKKITLPSVERTGPGSGSRGA